MQIVPFRAHCQSVCTNFDFSSFSRISCEVICVILRRKVTQVAWWFESKSRVIYVKWLCKQIWIARIGDKSLLLNSFNCLSRTKVFDVAICLKKRSDLSLMVRWFDADCMEFQCFLVFILCWFLQYSDSQCVMNCEYTARIWSGIVFHFKYASYARTFVKFLDKI